jgi:hypothetical protein
MTGRIERLRRVLSLLYDVLFATLAVYFCQGVFFKADINIIPFFILLAAFIISEICAEKCSNIFTLGIPQLAVCAGICFLPLDAGSRTVLCMLAFVRLISSVTYVKNGMKPRKLDEAPWVTVLAVLVIYGIGSYLKINRLVNSAYFMLVALLVIFFVRLYLQGLNGYVSSAKDVSGLTLSKIVSVNNVMIAGIILAFLVLVAISGLFDFSAVGGFILNCLKFIAVMIFYGLRFVVKFVVNLMFGDDDVTVEFEQADWDTVTEANNAGIIDDIFGFLVEAAILVGLVYLVYSAVKRFIRSFMIKRIAVTDVVEAADRDETEDLGSRKKTGGNMLRRDESMTARFRKLYRRSVKKHADVIGLKNTCTCGDIEEKLSGESGMDISEATRLYQQVRYGEAQVDRKMLKDIGSALKEK